MQRSVAAAIRESPSLRRARRASRVPRKFVLLRIAPLIGRAVLVGLVSYVMKATGHVLTGLAVLTIWAFLWSLLRTRTLQLNLFFADDRLALACLPIPDRDIFRWQLSKFYRAYRTPLIDLLLGLGTLAAFVDLPVVAWLGLIPIAALAWWLMIAMSLLLAARLPRVPYFLVLPGCFLAAFALWVAHDLLAPIVLESIDRHAAFVNALLPPGWVLSTFLALSSPHRWEVLYLLLPAGALVSASRNSIARLRRGYALGEPTLSEPPDPTKALSDPDDVSEEPSTAPYEEPIAAEPHLPTGFLGMETTIPRDGFARVLSRWLSVRENALAELLFPAGFPVLAPWIRLFRTFVFMVVATLLLLFAAPTAGRWALAGGLVLVGTQALSRLLDSGIAFQPLPIDSASVPFYAAYGIGFRELSCLLLKCALIQLPFVFALTLACSLLVVPFAGLTVSAAVVIGIKAAGLLLTARCVFLVLSFSGGTNDTARFRSAAPLLAMIIPLGGMFLLLGGAGLFVPHPIAWLFWVLAMLDAYAFLRLYGWLYDRTRFDLMSVPRQ